MRIAIVGTAGRKTDGNRLTPDHFDFMLEEAGKEIVAAGNVPITLVSGGAAWADHVAVDIALTHPERLEFPLELHLPCRWDAYMRRFHDDGSRDWRRNPGGTSNYYHRLFAMRRGLDAYATLIELDMAIRRGAVVKIGSGFHDRNSGVAKVDRLIAFTFADNGRPPNDSGTADTWRKAEAASVRCVHVSLAAVSR